MGARPRTTHTAAMIRHRITSLRSASGQTMTEYAVILAFLVFVVMAVLPLLGAQVTQLYQAFTNSF
jgi:Flp pilus assembly pilin Flp